MSLINEVLRDLDARHAADSERIGLSNQVRALPPAAVPLWKKALLPLVTAALGGAAVWFWQWHTLPAAIPAPVVAEAPIPTTSVVATEVPVESVAAKEVPASPPSVSSLKLDAEIGLVPTQPPRPKSKPISPAAADATQSVPVESVPKVKLPAVPAAQATNAPPQISKQMTSGSGTNNEQADAEYRRGLTALRRGAANEAGDAFRAALKLQANHSAARHALLAQLVEQRQWQAVEVVAMDGVGLQPNRHDWALLAARVQFDRGEVVQALDTMSQHASYARSNADYQVFHALLLQRSNRPAEAAICYQTALNINPAEGRWWYGLGRALDADHREPEARVAYEKARDSGNLPPELAQIVERRLH